LGDLTPTPADRRSRQHSFSDRQAANAVRARIDWNATRALGLELTDPGLDYSVLSEFRERMLAGQDVLFYLRPKCLFGAPDD
jgi:hypothetical protein